MRIDRSLRLRLWRGLPLPLAPGKVGWCRAPWHRAVVQAAQSRDCCQSGRGQRGSGQCRRRRFPCPVLRAPVGGAARGWQDRLEKKDLHFGFRTDYGADIASRHHHVLLSGQVLLQGKQSGTRFRLCGDLRHIRVNCGRADRPGDVFSAEQERELAAIGGSCLLARRLPGTVGGTMRTSSVPASAASAGPSSTDTCPRKAAKVRTR